MERVSERGQYTGFLHMKAVFIPFLHIDFLKIMLERAVSTMYKILHMQRVFL
jgi:hypothetical protein